MISSSPGASRLCELRSVVSCSNSFIPHLGHHARLHMVEIVVVECPLQHDSPLRQRGDGPSLSKPLRQACLVHTTLGASTAATLPRTPVPRVRAERR